MMVELLSVSYWGWQQWLACLILFVGLATSVGATVKSDNDNARVRNFDRSILIFVWICILASGGFWS